MAARLEGSALVLVALLAAGCDPTPPATAFGAYTLADGRILSLRERRAGGIRLTLYDTGETASLVEEGGAWRPPAERRVEDALTGLALTVLADGLRLRWRDGTESEAVHVPLDVRNLALPVGDIDLHVRLELPVGAQSVPVVVIVHGSGDDAATRYYHQGDYFAANGLGVVVFDKRGTGGSGGTYGHDLHRLADDVVAVVEWVAAQPGVDAARIGLSGYSQGGWIAPLAASRSEHVAFVIVNYGMIDSPYEEARLETRDMVARRGFSGADLDKVDEVTHATIAVLESGFETGWEELDAVVARYSNEPWLQAMSGTTFDEVTAWPHWLVRLVGPWVTPGGLPWHYDSRAALDQLASRGVPSVWLLADQDRSAPNAFTLDELARRIGAGEPVQVRVFPGTDHGIVQFVDAGGERTFGNFFPDYLRAQVERARRLAGIADDRPMETSR